ncbi:hypothetical protein K3495_g8482 [Podosphaera aphanis]|nr:hypothetical protein K3495_g8482 [Podosphaera aphanis]
MLHPKVDLVPGGAADSIGCEVKCTSLKSSPNLNGQHNNINGSLVSRNEDPSHDHNVSVSTSSNNMICDHQLKDEENAKNGNGENSDAIPLGLISTSQTISRPRSRQLCEAQNIAFNHLLPSKPVVQAASAHQTTSLKHPTPDLQTLQGANKGTVAHLERTAEQLSMTSAIEDAIKDLHEEQKRSESQQSSLLSSQVLSAKSRNITSSSILEVQNTARSSSYSPSEHTSSPKTPLSTFKSLTSSWLSRTELEADAKHPKSSVNEPSGLSPLSLSSAGVYSRVGQETRSTDCTPLNVSSLLKTERSNKGLDQARTQTDAMSSFKELSPTEMMESMFADFEGFQSSIDLKSQGDLISENRLSLEPKSQSQTGTAISQNMVYYPAPVPVMLNLPQKLSKKHPFATRKPQASNNCIDTGNSGNTGNSKIWESEMQGKTESLSTSEVKREEYLSLNSSASNLDVTAGHSARDLANLPPQLRASTFFENQGQTQVFKLKDKSAVATLDSILDASANAPVWAFTDHAFVGALGPEVYGKKSSQDAGMLKKRTGSFGVLTSRNNGSSERIDPLKEQRQTASSALGSNTEGNENSKDNQSDRELAAKSEYGESEDEGQEDEIYHGPPTTLLAELQLRKQRQKQRTQPLTKTFPNGIHSTLLELDSAIQTEQNTRRKERTILAWEDPSELIAQDDDDDVPLAMLYSHKATENRPLGLLERRALEDNEPLSQRRNRLQGGTSVPNRVGALNNILTSGDDEEEEETLGERAKRLKATTIPLPLPLPERDQFADMMGQFESKDSGSDSKKMNEANSSKVTEEEETLGQRRKRLQAEREARLREVGVDVQPLHPQRLFNKSHGSTTDILSSYPTMGGINPQSYERPIGGLLAAHEKKAALRSASMQNIDTSKFSQGPAYTKQQSVNAFKAGIYNDGRGGTTPSKSIKRGSNHYAAPAFSQSIPAYPSTGDSFPGVTGLTNSQMIDMGDGIEYTTNRNQPLNVPAQMKSYLKNFKVNTIPKGVESVQPLQQPLEQGQMDRVERWRQSVTPLAKPAS